MNREEFEAIKLRNELKEKADLVYTDTNDCPTCKDIDPEGMGARHTGTLCPDCEK